MLRMKYVVGLAVVLAMGLLPGGVAVCETPATSDAQWDDVGPVEGSYGEFAFMDAEDAGPGEPGIRTSWPKRGHDHKAGLMPGMPVGGRQGPPHDGDHDRRGPAMRDPYHQPGRGMTAPGMMGRRGRPTDDPEMRELMKRNIELAHKSRRLASEYGAASEERQAEIKQEVEKLVNEHFDVRQQRRNLELKRLEEKLQELREAVKQREQARRELIDRRISHLLRLEPEF